MRHLWFLLGVPLLSSVIAAAEPAQPLFRSVDLDIGETQEIKLSDGAAAKSNRSP